MAKDPKPVNKPIPMPPAKPVQPYSGGGGSGDPDKPK